jgi:predicted transcriptional regulator
MHEVQVQLSDQLYDKAAQRANLAGFQTVDEYIADIVQHDLLNDLFDADEFFTPQVIAKLDEAAAEADAGRLVTFEDLTKQIEERRKAWRQDHAS